MSMIDQPMSRDPVERHERKPLTRAERELLMHRQNGVCANCPAPLTFFINDIECLTPMIDEHVIPLWLGGTNDLANRALYCVPCAKAKTKREATERGKVLRLERDHKPETRRKTPHRLRGRGFGGKDPLR